MKSTLFNQGHNETQAREWLALQNPYMLKARVYPQYDLIAQKGSMVAYQGNIEFAHEGSSSVGQFLKKMVSSDDQPLMRVTGDGEVFLASQRSDIHLLELENESITVNGKNLLAFQAHLKYDLNRVQGAGMVTGGLFNTTLTGQGTVAILAQGEPVILDCSQQPTFTDMNATVGWSANLVPGIKSSFTAGALIGRGSGEGFQYAFHGPGWVIVQPSEWIAASTTST